MGDPAFINQPVHPPQLRGPAALASLTLAIRPPKDMRSCRVKESAPQGPRRWREAKRGTFLDPLKWSEIGMGPENLGENNGNLLTFDGLKLYVPLNMVTNW